MRRNIERNIERNPKRAARSGLLVLLASLASACSGADTPASWDFLARLPDESKDAPGVHADPRARRVVLDPGASVRYRLEVLTSSTLTLAVRGDPGRLELVWARIDPADGAATVGETSEVELEEGEVERVLSVPVAHGLVELRLTWHGSSSLELRNLQLQESTPVERPSILLIVIDTLSARHLSAYGYPLETDPELKRLASESYLFEHCFTNGSWTLPSFLSLMTGVYARAHELDLTSPELWQRWYLAQSRWTLAEALRAAGYRTGGFVDSPWLAGALGFDQGFDVFDDSAAADAFTSHDDPDAGIRLTSALATAFLAGLPPRQPFFAFVHAFDVHSPYTAQPPPDKRSRGTEPYDFERTVPVGGPPEAFGIIPTFIARTEIPEGELPVRMHPASIERSYDEGVRFLDEELGHFLERLRAQGVLDRCWLVFTADHGETMADSEHYFVHGVLSQDVVHVPLVVRPPGGLAAGQRIAQTVQLVDLYPTLLELAGAECGRAYLAGHSLLPLLRGETRAADVVLTEGGIMRQSMLVSDGWELIEREPTKDSSDAMLLSYPGLTREWFAKAEQERRARLHRPAAEAEGEAERVGDGGGLLAWRGDDELQRDLFERLPVSGLTEELLGHIRSRPGCPQLVRFLRRALNGPFYELYHLDLDPQAKKNVAAEHPQELARLKALLAHEQQRRDEARRHAQRPSAAVALPSESVEALKALGYGGGPDDER